MTILNDFQRMMITKSPSYTGRVVSVYGNRLMLSSDAGDSWALAEFMHTYAPGDFVQVERGRVIGRAVDPATIPVYQV